MTPDRAHHDPLPTPGDARVPAPASGGPRAPSPMGLGGWIPLLGAAIPVAVFLLGWLEHRLAPPPTSPAAPAPSLRPFAAPETRPQARAPGDAPPRATGTGAPPERPARP